MVEMKISEAECLKLAKLIDADALPTTCKDFVSKAQKNKSAWEGASHHDFMMSNHRQLQRKLTTSKK